MSRKRSALHTILEGAARSAVDAQRELETQQVRCLARLCADAEAAGIATDDDMFRHAVGPAYQFREVSYRLVHEHSTRRSTNFGVGLEVFGRPLTRFYEISHHVTETDRQVVTIDIEAIPVTNEGKET